MKIKIILIRWKDCDNQLMAMKTENIGLKKQLAMMTRPRSQMS